MMIKFEVWSKNDEKDISNLMNNLYHEDPTGKPISLEKIELTFKTLRSQPARGKILTIKNDNEIIGYSILINFWSNEFGGNILMLDELYIKPEYRSQGIGSTFINYLIKTMPENSVAIQLEVTPNNILAKKLYKRLGFSDYENHLLSLDLN